MSSSSPQKSSIFIYILFVLSGLTSLVYEIVWTRILSTILGNTSLAISIVVSLFMAGLACGSLVSARSARLRKNPLLSYALLELLIGIYAVFTPEIAQFTDAVYGRWYDSVANLFWLSVLLKASVTILLFSLPTLAMGATLPLLIQSFSPAERHGKAARLYGLNTFGAVFGTLLSGYILIPSLGIRTTIYFTALLNVLIFAGAWILSRRISGELENVPRVRSFHPVYVLVFFTGFASLAFEILWARALSMFFGSSVYAFSAILAAFLMGIAVGSSYYSNRISESVNPYQFFSLIQFRLSLAAMFFVGIFMGIPLLLIRMFETLNQSFPLFQVSQFLLISATMFYATFLSGAAFPAALHFFKDKARELSSFTAYIYTYNTIGSILGSLFAGFVFIPLLGVEGGIRFTVLVSLVLGIYCFRRIPAEKQDRRVLAIGGVSLALLLFLPYWNKSIYNAGFYAFAYRYVPGASIKPASQKSAVPSSVLSAGMFPTTHDSSELNMIYYGEGLTATVAVVENETGIRSLLINGKPDASNVPTGDMRTQLLLGHLPVLLHGEAESALVIGLGSGVTSGALRAHGLKRVDCVEIEKKVVLASRYFEAENLHVLQDPNFHLILDDGRNVVQHTSRKYDILTSEPSNLWISGVANLFTREFFLSARNRLNSKGVMCQWIHLYQISIEDVLIFLKTFHSVFPHMTIWIDDSDMLVVGSEQSLQQDIEQIETRISGKEVIESLSRSNLTAENIIKKYAGDESMVKILRSTLLINTDDHPVLEFSAPKSLFRNDAEQIVQSIRALREIAQRQDSR